MTDGTGQSAELRIQGDTLIALYLHLSESERELPHELQLLTDQLERVLYDHLSIEQMENLNRLYAAGKPILGRGSEPPRRDRRES